MKTREITYHDGAVECIGYVACPDDVSNAPAVLLAHDWSGRN